LVWANAPAAVRSARLATIRLRIVFAERATLPLAAPVYHSAFRRRSWIRDLYT
jgi:hypothetical protein